MSKRNIDGFEIVETEDGSLTVKDRLSGEDYHSKSGALIEARSLFLEASGAKQRITRGDELRLLDVGLGLGYNALTLIEYWLSEDNATSLSIDSLEYDEKLVENLMSETPAWSKGWPDAWFQILASLESQAGKPKTIAANIRHRNGAKLDWRILIGDALSQQLASNYYDIIYQDAFSPENNPKLWSQQWFTILYQTASSGASLVSYSVARVVKDNLAGSGWDYTKIPGSGRKKSWLKASKP